MNNVSAEWCKTCKDWQATDAKGECERCDRQVVVISESVVLAELRSKYGVE